MFSFTIIFQVIAHPAHVPCTDIAKLSNISLDSLIEALSSPDVDSKYEKLVYCEYKRLNIIDEDGKVDFDAMKRSFRRIHKNYYDEAIDYCRHLKQHRKPMKNAYQAMKCLFDLTQE